MGKVTGFMEYERVEEHYAPVQTRVKHHKEFIVGLREEEAKVQGARCMDCGIPFCNNGCPVNNIIPDFNDLVYRGDWKNAWHVLDSTNNFPEFTGRICPAPCEEACTLNVNDDPVGIKSIEHAIIDRAWQEGWVVPRPAAVRTGKSRDCSAPPVSTIASNCSFNASGLMISLAQLVTLLPSGRWPTITPSRKTTPSARICSTRRSMCDFSILKSGMP